jgi:hypothetical protein
VGRTAELQNRISPLPILRRRWFKRNTILCEEGWSLTFSGSSRVDTYDYCENERHIIFGGEGSGPQMDIFLYSHLAWEDAPRDNVDEQTRQRVLHNITAALQWAGFSVGFFSIDGPATL